MIKEEFYFDSRDGESRIHAVRYTPDDGNVKGIVQVVHGMAEYVERYENLAEFLTARGILVTGEEYNNLIEPLPNSRLIKFIVSNGIYK